MKQLQLLFGRHSDLLLVGLVVGVLVILFAPIPAPLLDFLILCNVSFALLLLLLTFYMERPVEFSTFPSLLLVATLFRLSLNVAATRLILADADAGKVIGSVGSFVVGGNYVIGFIVFLILVVVQYVVVTNGAQRVSEVAARFTLDSMPGQQMSIDADLNMGLIDQEEAQRRRKNIEREAGFYGAMDGASKFVKGDAIAGIIILLINSIGGLVIGVMQHGMPWGQALQTYTLLTIGDGIVTQVPALIISVATGIIVTRSASDAQLSGAVLRQLTAHPKTIFLVAAALMAMVLMPGIPAVPVVAIATLLLLAGWAARQTAAFKVPSVAEVGSALDPDEGYAALKVEPIEVMLGSALTPLLTGAGSTVTDRVAAFRKQFALEVGLIIPSVRFREGGSAESDRYDIQFFGVSVGRGELHSGKALAIHPSGDTKSVTGKETREPTYGLPAVWVDDAERERARTAGFTVVDPQTVFLTHLIESVRQNAATLLTRHEMEQVLQRVRDQQPGLVEELIPTVLPVSDVQRILQALLREKVSIRNLEAIFEALLESGRTIKDAGLLTDVVRQRLGSTICQSIVGDSSALDVLILDPAIEQNLQQCIRRTEPHAAPVLEPGFAEQLLAKLAASAERMVKSNLAPVLLCSPELRRHLRGLSERAIPHLRVISFSEVPNAIHLKSFGTVSL